MRSAVLSLLGPLALGACGGGPSSSASPDAAVPSMYAIFDRRPASFFDLPYPTDLRQGTDGTIDLTGFPAPTPLVATFVEQVRTYQRGFGANAGAFLRFGGTLDSATLPATPADSIAAGAAVFLVDIDAHSAGRGTRAPATVAFHADGGRYIDGDYLVVTPALGFPLAPGTTYAAVVTDGARGSHGELLGPGRDFASTLASEPAFAPLAAWLAEPAQAALAGHVVTATVFTTGAPASAMLRAREALDAVDAPAPHDVTQVDTQPDYRELQGRFDVAIFQAGQAPYREEGGAIALDADGKPIVDHVERLRFALTVPAGPAPASGWPVVIYGHGTGGDFHSFIDDGTAARLARVRDRRGHDVARLAAISMDEPLQGERSSGGARPELLFYNFFNPVAGRDNSLQSALDKLSLVRLVEHFTTDDPDARLDASRIYYMGHSEGAITGPLFLAVEPDVRAVVLSGAGGGLIRTLTEQTSEFDIPLLLSQALGETPDATHPALHLIQAFVEPADPLNYARFLVEEPRSGGEPKPVLMTIGIGDTYTPNATAAALGAAIGAPPVEPVIDPSLLDAPSLAGLSPAAPPLSSNVPAAGGSVTCGMTQYQPGPGYDGHFVAFRQGAAIRQVTNFLATAAAQGIPVIVP